MDHVSENRAHQNKIKAHLTPSSIVLHIAIYKLKIRRTFYLLINIVSII